MSLFYKVIGIALLIILLVVIPLYQNLSFKNVRAKYPGKKIIVEMNKKSFQINLIFIVVAAIALLVFEFVPLGIEDQSGYALLSFTMLCACAGNALSWGLKGSLYHTDNGVFVKETFVPYKQISRCETDKKTRRAYLVLINGKRYQLTPYQYKEILKLI